jgi:hypothetical protein
MPRRRRYWPPVGMVGEDGVEDASTVPTLGSMRTVLVEVAVLP